MKTEHEKPNRINLYLDANLMEKLNQISVQEYLPVTALIKQILYKHLYANTQGDGNHSI
jgi:hypothetical protein